MVVEWQRKWEIEQAMSVQTAKKGRTKKEWTTSETPITKMDSQHFEEPKAENNIDELLKMYANIYAV